MQLITKVTKTHNSPYALLVSKIYNSYYLLLSKLYNDVLEVRLGYYRQLSRANYFVTLMDVLDSESKIRFKDTIIFVC